MAITLLTTQSDIYDLVSKAQVLSYTPDAANPRYIKIKITAGGGGFSLDGSGGDFELELFIQGVLFDGADQTKTLDGVFDVQFQTANLIVPANAAINLFLQSPNAPDTSVSVVVEVYDIPAGDPVDGSITEDTYDKSTAFAVAQVDSGATSIAREGADGSTHTLNTLSSQIGGISGGGSALSEDADSVDITTGSETTGTYVDTWEQDGVYHGVTEVGGVLDYLYTVNIGPQASPTGGSFNGRLDEGSNPSGGDTVDIVAYNFTTSSVDIIKGVAFTGVVGSTSANDTTEEFGLKSKHVDTNGDVRVGIRGASLDTNTEFLCDKLVVDYTQVGSLVGYDGGQIWLNMTGGGFPGAVRGTNGVADHPSDNLVDALALSVLTSLGEFHISPLSQVDLIANATGMVGRGSNWFLGLEDQVITSATIIGATVSGQAHVSSGSADFVKCHIAVTGLTASDMDGCTIDSTLTLIAPGDTRLVDCVSGIAGSGAPTIDMGVGVGASTLELRRWSGGASVVNIETGDVVSVDGLTGGTLTLGMAGGLVEARGAGMKAIVVNGTSGTVNVAGFFGTITDNSGGAVTIDTTWTFQQVIANALLVTIPATLFAGITSIGQWLGLIAGKQAADATALAEIKATGAGSGTYDEARESQEAIRDRGDAAWTTGGSGDIIIAPLQASTVNSGQQNATYLTAYQHADSTSMFAVTDKNKDPVDLSAIDLTFIAWDQSDPETIIFSFNTASGQITISGDDDNQVTVNFTPTETAVAYVNLQWRLIGTVNNVQYSTGYLKIDEAAEIP